MIFPYIKFRPYSKFMFFKSPGEKGDLFNFSSDLDQIGKRWDIAIQNGTPIELISDHVTIDNIKYGMLSVVKIKADVSTDYHTIIKEFWIPTYCVANIHDNSY